MSFPSPAVVVVSIPFSSPDVAKSMDSVPTSTNEPLSAAAIARQTQECLDELKNLALGNPESPPKVLLCIGRPGTGKSSFVEDASGLRGYSKQSLDPVTQRCELAKVRIEDEPCFIMDTPGVDQAHAEAIFLEIVRGIQTILSTSQIAGFLYFTCINQPRFDSVDRQVLQLAHALAGHDYIPCVTFITTFWTADRPAQQANFKAQLKTLKGNWRTALGVQELHCYQHGRGYSAGGEVTEAFIDWFDDSGRNQMAEHAKDMITRRYCGPDASAPMAITPKIVQELRHGIPLHETDAGRILQLQPGPSYTGPLPTSNKQHRGDKHQDSSSARSNSNSGSAREESHDTASRDIPRTAQGEPKSPQAPGRTWWEASLDVLSRVIQNVNINVEFGAPGGSMGGPRGGTTSAIGRRSGGISHDPLSSVDVMKSYGLDSSPEGRLRYAAEHRIGGQPYSAAWGEAIRQDVLRRNRQ